MRLLTVADGFGDSNIVPPWYPDFYKWPEIIKLMTKGLELTNLSRYGAGNEYITQCVKHYVSNMDVALVQWTNPDRLDLVLDHNIDFWKQQIENDSTYKDNVVSLDNHQYWLSSSSKNENVREYHEKYIGIEQHRLRSQLFAEYAKLLFEQKGISYGFMLTYDSEYFDKLDIKNWVCHEPFKGMNTFRKVSQYAELDSLFNLTQPISLIHFEFIKKFIMPNFDLNWRSNRDIDAVENMLHRKYKEALVLKNDSL